VQTVIQSYSAGGLVLVGSLALFTLLLQFPLAYHLKVVFSVEDYEDKWYQIKNNDGNELRIVAIIVGISVVYGAKNADC
jgi:hypothetical protein